MFNHVTACCATDDGRILTASKDNCLRVWVLNDKVETRQHVPSPLTNTPARPPLKVPKLIRTISHKKEETVSEHEHIRRLTGSDDDKDAAQPGLPLPAQVQQRASDADA